MKRKKLIRLNINKNSEITMEERKNFARKMQNIINSNVRVMKIDECGLNLKLTLISDTISKDYLLLNI